MGQAEIEAFLTYLAVEGKVAASTQNQAFDAILFLYRDVLNQTLDFNIQAVRAKRSTHLPTVLTSQEVQATIAQMNGTYRLLIQLLHGGQNLPLASIPRHSQTLGQGVGTIGKQNFGCIPYPISY